MRYNQQMALGVYIQVPFCQTKCTYCNFHTGVVSRDRYERYARAVCQEIANGVAAGGPVDTVYVGGGTPSLLDPRDLAAILDAVRAAYATRFREVTLEADPETITADKASAWLAAGFNRISLGAQSFQDTELRVAGRMHRRSDIVQAVELLRAVGFRNISVDLIAGMPHQTGESWADSIRLAVGQRPEHLSIYMLEIDEGSRLGRESLAGGSRYSAREIPPDDDIAEFYDHACRQLADAGYEHYEISNWGLPGFCSSHNLKYWLREPYIGFGAGAHSFNGRERWANAHDAAKYVAAIESNYPVREQIETVTPQQALDEEFFLGLRRLEGIDVARIERECDKQLSHRITELRQKIDHLTNAGLIETHDGRVRLAPKRLTVSNEVFVELMS